MGTDVKSKGTELVAKRWAKALMDLVSEDNGIFKEDILGDLCEVDENIVNSSELSSVLNNPSVSIEEKQVVLTKLFEGKLRPISFNFIKLLNSKGRLDILPEVANEFRKELESLKNISRVNITSAIELSDDKKNDIKNRIAEKLHKDIIAVWNVDSSIIGGLIFNINEIIVDTSIKHKLENLSNNIVKG